MFECLQLEKLHVSALIGHRHVFFKRTYGPIIYIMPTVPLAITHNLISNIEVTYYAIQPGWRDLPITCAHNMYSRTVSSLEENLTIANQCRNM